ncbi:MAG TPA: RNase adapter RapZ [Gammaproteobacteria bacterium]|nr:RNase adapter RapZ [Gammaproteobacteria bacterium]HAT27530.1 RNase adapter RapZ [Gammaproteobacteria bacterium]|tara:strand:- start:1352 stop:2209 length:858 start_codon:yes stop_codon:yes gene_type:complete
MKLTIISGRSGSGKSTVLHVLEDRGYYCIDNLPASLLSSLASRISSDATGIPNVAVSIDARNISADLDKFPSIINELKNKPLSTEIVFLDANSQTLLKRFSESRRKHPLSSEAIGLKEAIDKESELLEAISIMASLSIDTSNMSLHQLRDTVKNRLLDDQQTTLALLFQSFGFKNGLPVDADIVYDVRCLPNPYWDNSLRSLTGLDDAVVGFLDSQEEVQEMCSDIENFLLKWIPSFESNNRSYITVALGCTGGQHRSVYMCEKLGEIFSTQGSNVQVRHRELDQ